MRIFDDFSSERPHPYWNKVTAGTGDIRLNQSSLRLSYSAAEEGKYSDAQIDDYTMLAKADYIWRPPLRMKVRARFSNIGATSKFNTNGNHLKGTAGFGFWNKPFTMQGNIFTLPETAWFFYSAPPSNMALVPGVPGYGWKTQTIHTKRFSAIMHAGPLALSFLYGKMTGNFNPANRYLQKFAGVDEYLLNHDMTEWHTYTLEWHKHYTVYWVDGVEIIRSSYSPTASLGFVAWIDNEYAVATTKGELQFGKISAGSQWLDIDSVLIENI